MLLWAPWSEILKTLLSPACLSCAPHSDHGVFQTSDSGFGYFIAPGQLWSQSPSLCDFQSCDTEGALFSSPGDRGTALCPPGSCCSLSRSCACRLGPSGLPWCQGTAAQPPTAPSSPSHPKSWCQSGRDLLRAPPTCGRSSRM